MLTHLRELYRFRDLLFSLVVRDIKVRYRQTLLGILWAVFQPLAFMVIFTLVFAKFGRIETGSIPYPLFSYTGLVPWTFFSTGVVMAVNSVAAHMSLVKKIYFPREVLPIGVVLGCFTDFLIAASLIAGMMLFYRVPATPHLLWLPWLIGLEIALLISVGLFVSSVNVFYRDVKYIVPLLVQLGLFVTPVIYSTATVPAHFRRWYMLNPMAVVVDGVRRVVLQGQPPQLGALLLATALVAAFSLFSYAFFKKIEVRFADLI